MWGCVAQERTANIAGTVVQFVLQRGLHGKPQACCPTGLFELIRFSLDSEATCLRPLDGQIAPMAYNRGRTEDTHTRTHRMVNVTFVAVRLHSGTGDAVHVRANDACIEFCSNARDKAGVAKGEARWLARAPSAGHLQHHHSRPSRFHHSPKFHQEELCSLLSRSGVHDPHVFDVLCMQEVLG